MKDNKMNDKEPYVPITEDMADNDLLEEYEAQLAAQKQARTTAPQPAEPAVEEPIAPVVPAAAPQTPEPKKPVYKQWWFWCIIAVVIVGIIIAVVVVAKKGKKVEQSTSLSTSATTQTTTESTSAATQTTEQTTTESTTASTTKAATTEDEDSKESRFNYALEKAKALNSLMHLSKQGIYNELVSKNGEGLKADAAQYAIDHLKANYKANALFTAKGYAAEGVDEDAIYEKLLNEDLFTDEESQYAVDHLD